MRPLPPPAWLALGAVTVAFTATLAFVAGSANAAAPKPQPTSLPPLPTKPFTKFVSQLGTDPQPLVGPATGTIAITHVTASRFTEKGNSVYLYRSDVGPDGKCQALKPSDPSSMMLELIAMPRHETVDQSFTTPMVVTPAVRAGKPRPYCLMFALSHPEGYWTATVTGYTVSGSTTIPAPVVRPAPEALTP